MKIAVGADPWALELKNTIKAHLEEREHEVIDVGGLDAGDERPYYEVAASVAEKIRQGEAERGILFCGTGMGVGIVANKFKGIYAAVIESEFTAKMSRAVNNANVLAMGSMVVAPHIATLAVDAWLQTVHTEGLEEYQDFLRTAVAEVAKIDDANLK